MPLPPATASARLRALLGDQPVIPVLTIADADIATPLAAALVAGGLPMIEVTLRTPAAFAAIARMAAVRGAIVGAGTLLDPGDVRLAQAAGAVFGVSPGATPALLAACSDEDLPVLPGAATASEVMALRAAGFRFLKFFPAAQAGGPAALRALAGPLPDIAFCPTGGITPHSLADYLALPNVACVGGSWLAPAAMLAAGDWPGITALARQAAQAARPAP